MKFLYLILLLTTCVGCDVSSRTPVVVNKQEVVSCYYKHDSSINVKYQYNGIARVKKSDINQYLILDIDGKRHMYNQYEFDDFICDKSKFPEVIVIE
jgi:hypothetical protein